MARKPNTPPDTDQEAGKVTLADAIKAGADLQPYPVLGNLNHDGKPYVPGDVVHLDADTALILGQLDVVLITDDAES